MTKKKRDTPILLEIQCIKCNEIKPIPQVFTHKTRICEVCRNKAQKILQAKYRMERRLGRESKGAGGRVCYPLGDWKSAKIKFKTLQRELQSIEDRLHWKSLIKTRLEELMTNKPLYEWILNHVSDSPSPMIKSKKAKKHKPGPNKLNEYPDTRNEEL